MKHTYILYILIIFICVGCKTDSENESATSYTKVTGKLEGHMYLAGDYGAIDTSLHGGILVQIENTRYSAITDSKGYWAIDSLPTGTYSISFSKEGYYPWKNTSFTFIGGGIVDFCKNTFGRLWTDPCLPPVVQYTVTFDSTIYDSKTDLIVYGHTSKINRSGVLTICVYLNDNFETNHYMLDLFSPRVNLKGADTIISFSHPIPYSYVNEQLNGDSIGFVTLRPRVQLVGNVQYYYTDWGTGKMIFTGFGPSLNAIKIHGK